MGFMSSTTRPPEDVERILKRNAGVGVIIKARHDALPPEKGVTRLPPTVDKLWNKKAQRYRYEKGVLIRGKKVGGRFTTAPKNAPPERKRKKKK